MKKIIFPILILLFIVSCNQNETDKVKEDISNKTIIENKTSSDYLIMSTLWFQLSAERQALSYQAFNWARKMLDENYKLSENGLLPAVVVDLDETMIDNSPFEGKCIETNSSYTSETWKAWTDKAQAKAIHGALDFCNYAEFKGVKVFYISNRRITDLESTMKNMASLGFPNIEEEFFLLKDKTSSKKSRREKVQEKYDILLLIGDNLSDFDEVFEMRDENYGFNIVDDYKDEFGNKFILLPNPMYGDWEKAIFGGSYNLTGFQKDSIRRASIISH